MKKLLPLHAMAENFGLVSKSLRPKLGRRSYFTPEGKVALMFLKMYTGLSCPKLMEQLNGNIHYQMFCDSDGGLVRHTERALRPEASQSTDEADGNPVHLLRHTHGKRGVAGRQDRAESTSGGCLKRKYAHRKVLSRGNYASAIENEQTIWPKRPERDIKT